MRKRVASIILAVLVAAVVWMAPEIAEAGRLVLVRAELTESCANCQTDTPLVYSVLGDADGAYTNGGGVKSQIISHNTIYNLDTLDTLVNGQVASGTRTVRMHFYSSVEGSSLYPGHVLPPCWNGNRNQEQAVNWIILSDNSQTLTGMRVGQQVQGRARMDFNVRNGSCENQIFRFYLQWYNVCITRTSATTWDATSDLCGRANNYGTANLSGQGGRKKQTLDYGDWRMPFKMTLSLQ